MVGIGSRTITRNLLVMELRLGFGWDLVKLIFQRESVFEGVGSNLPLIKVVNDMFLEKH